VRIHARTGWDTLNLLFLRCRVAVQMLPLYTLEANREIEPMKKRKLNHPKKRRAVDARRNGLRQGGQSPPSRVPPVFISYTHENTSHKLWVRELAKDLIANGVEVIIDQWDLPAGADFTLFMEQGIRTSTRVLLIFTPEYCRKANQRTGGVGYESLVVTGELAKDLGTTKFIGILRSGTWSTSVPSFLATRNHIDFRDDSKYAASLEQLLRELYNAPEDPKPPIGTNPFAPQTRQDRGHLTGKSPAKRGARMKTSAGRVESKRPEQVTEPQQLSLPTGTSAAHVQISYKVISESANLHRYALTAALTLNRPPTQGEWLLKLLWPYEVRVASTKGLRAEDNLQVEGVTYKQFAFHGERRIWPGETVEIIGPKALSEIEYEYDIATWNLLHRESRDLHYTIYLEDHRPVEGAVPLTQLNCFQPPRH